MPRALLHFADDAAVDAFRSALDGAGLWRKRDKDGNTIGYRTMPPGERLRVASGDYPQAVLDVAAGVAGVTVKVGDVATLRRDPLVVAEKERVR